MSTLGEVYDARAARDIAERRLRRAVRDAQAAGVPVAEVARAAAISRPTAYRWRDDEPDDPATLMDAALWELIGVGAGPLHELRAGLGTKLLDAKARRVLLCGKNAPPDAQYNEVIGAGIAAAHEVMAQISP